MYYLMFSTLNLEVKFHNLQSDNDVKLDQNQI